MDAKITLSFDEKVIEKAKAYAEKQNMSLSRLMEFLLDKITSSNYKSLEDFPVSDWVNMVSEGPAEYQRTPVKRKKAKSEYYEKNLPAGKTRKK